MSSVYRPASVSSSVVNGGASAPSVSSSRRARRSDVSSIVFQQQQQQQRGGQQAASSPLGAYLQAESYQRPQDSSRPPIFELWEGGARGGFQERLVAAADYSLPQQQYSASAVLAAAGQQSYGGQYPYATSLSLDKSSMAPSNNQPPPQIHHRAHAGPPSASYASASASQYASSTTSHTGGPPSLVDDASSCLQSTVDTDVGGNALLSAGVQQRLEEGPDGVLIQPTSTTAALVPVYECTFAFLGCRFAAGAADEAAWRTHNLSHFHGHAPPRQVQCPLCDWGFQDPRDGHRAWDARMSHLAAHMRHGHSLASQAARPDFKLYQFLWQKRIIDDAEYKELRGGGGGSVGSGGAMHTTQGQYAQGRRERQQYHPRSLWVG